MAPPKKTRAATPSPTARPLMLDPPTARVVDIVLRVALAKDRLCVGLKELDERSMGCEENPRFPSIGGKIEVEGFDTSIGGRAADDSDIVLLRRGSTSVGRKAVLIDASVSVEGSSDAFLASPELGALLNFFVKNGSFSSAAMRFAVRGSAIDGDHIAAIRGRVISNLA